MVLPIADQLVVAVANRDKLFRRIQDAYDIIKDPAKVAEFKIRVKRADETLAEFEKVIDLIVTLNTQAEAKADRVDCKNSMTNFEDLYYKVKAYESLLNAQDPPPTVQVLPQEAAARAPQIRLPTINVPIFTGDISAFPAFKSLYNQLIHSNTDLSDIQKFSYLKAYVSGSAASCIDHIAFQAQNYPLAYQAVVKRFGKKRVLANAYLSKILKFTPLQNDHVKGLRNFLDVFHINVESLKGLNIADLGEYILLQLGLKSLDDQTRLDFESKQAENSFPEFEDLVKFVRQKCAILDLTNDNSTNRNKVLQPPSHRTLVTTNHTEKAHPSSDFKVPKRSNKSFSCSVCNSGDHRIASCPKFLKMDVSKRYTQVKELKLCFACLSSTHSRPDCQSVYQCKFCRSTHHHSLLHSDSSGGQHQRSHGNPGRVYHNDQQPHSSSSGQSRDNPLATALPASQTSHCGNHLAQPSSVSRSVVLLGTAVIQVQDSYGVWHPIRCILDNGSQISIISQRLAQQLKLPRRSSNIQISGIDSDHPVRAKGELMFQLLPHPGMVKPETKPISIQAAILPKIASNLATEVSTTIINKFRHLPLADLTYVNPNLASNIDLLIGAEYYCQLIDNSSQIILGNPSAVPSMLGWLLIGKCQAASNQNESYRSFFVTEDPISTQLQKFWELEELPYYQPQDPEAISCEQHFVATHQRDHSGKYVLRLPFKDCTPPDLGSNVQLARKRLQSLDNKLSKDPEQKKLYHDNLMSYIEPGHMRVAPESSNYLLIHFGIYKPSSSSTPLRVVFDPNTTSYPHGKNLASSLLVGPKLQKDISDLLIQWRLHTVVLLCDIQAMYRNIWIHPEDRKYQHIFWHENDSMVVTEFELTTCTFGLPSSPYQAQRVLRQLALDEGTQFPNAANVLRNEVYVDDLVTGASTVSEAIDLRDEIISLLSKGGFSVRKWASSNPAVLEGMTEDLCEKPRSFSEGGEESIKVLGMQWCPKTDSFFYVVSENSTLSDLTKRQVLAFVAKIYDCNGLLGPVTIWMKIFLQKLWLDSSLSWDTPLSTDLREKWETFISELSLLSSLKIPRCIALENLQSINLIGFADASKAAYAAVVYLRTCSSDGQVKTYLLRAKTKVAPLKVLTINRLELCAALLLAKTVKSLDFLSQSISINNVYLFSDSCVVLSWLKTPPYQLKIYVANRITQILEITEPAQWRHVTTDKNSADPASRGLVPSQLVNNGLWFKGPAFLKLPIEEWPQPLTNIEQQVLELKPSTSLMAHIEVNPLITAVEKFSSLNELKRVFSYVLRFIDGCRKRRATSAYLSLAESDRALEAIIRITQQCYLRDELKAVKSDEPVGNPLRPLSPILNSAGILAVGGRLSQAPLPESSKHPVLLPKTAHLTKLLINHYHDMTLHGGPKVVQSLLQRFYWIIGARNLVRNLLSKCVKCIRMKPMFHQPLMADLPASRFAQGRAFLNVGVDLAGPFSLKSGPRRNSPIVKAYFSIFVCMSVKAIHLELLSSLSTPCFLAALDRFIGRRGLPSAIFSDNGTNFRGAARHLSETHQFLASSQPQIESHLLAHQIAWIFNPPSAPNFGGLWEAGVKSVKKHLKHVLHNQSFNYEEFQTILISCEAICNSRPLCAIGVNPNDGVDILTPGHFLTGAPLLARAESDVSETYIPPLKRWLLVSQATQCFWKRWKSDYLNTLIQRNKWTSSTDNIKVDDVVIIQTPNCPPQHWPLGIVTKVSPGVDNVVRVATVRTSHGVLSRPASKLAILPVGDPRE
uniref:Integrase catalytic domain-containing protein n=1 Tax=Cacopsylla melanoneura TaxID=428564 RepID=A0A8D8T1R1_9HEMI